MLKQFFLIITVLLLAACSTNSKQLAPVVDGWRQPSNTQGVYRVKKGDTLYSIAWRYGHDYRTLAAINGIAAPYTIKEGQTLRLTGSVSKPVAKKTVAKTTTASKQKPGKATKSAAKYVGKKVSKWQWPTQGNIISRFGKENKGIDIAGKPNQSIRAAADGQVAYSGSGLRGYGNLLIIKHNEDFLSAYAHNSKLLVKEGALVKAGQEIAKMGSSDTSRIKLHFEIRHKGKPVNPENYLGKR